MQTRLISIVARLFSALSLSINQSLGSAAGWVAWATRSRARRITQFNIEHCFPDQTDQQRNSMVLRSLQHTGKQLFECAWIWNRPNHETLNLIRETRGEQYYLDAVASTRGVIMVTPHIGNWELCGLVISRKATFTYFYRSPRNASLAPLLLKWRAHVGGHPASLDSGGIREGLRILRNGGVVGILPDQEPDRDNGIFVPLFGQPALTMTLLPRLAARSNAHIILIVAERLPKAQGWRIHYLPANPAVANSDLTIAATAMNGDVEKCISLCPDQYLWDYKRFATLPDGERRQY